MDKDKLHSPEADRLIVGDEPAVERNPVLQNGTEVTRDRIAFTQFRMDDPDKVLLQGVFYLPLTFEQVKEKMILPEAKKKQHEDFAELAERMFKKKVKYLLKKAKK